MDAFHVLPLGKIFGPDGMRLEAAWGRATCRPLYQKSDNYRRGYASGSTGLPLEVDFLCAHYCGHITKYDQRERMKRYAALLPLNAMTN